LTLALLAPAAGVGTAVTTFMSAFLLSLLFRRPWLYWPAFVFFWPAITAMAVPQATAGDRVVMIAGMGIYFALIAAFIYRFGWLGNLVAASCLIWLAGTPLTTDTSAWYFGWGLAGAAVVLALGMYGFITAVGGQRLFREGFFGDE
jgi:hypothetical protein